MSIPILGTKPHQSAEAAALLAILPFGAKVHLVPEPENIHDPGNAIAVRFHLDDLKKLSALAVTNALGPIGYSTQRILACEWWHLGYIPRIWPRERKCPDCKGQGKTPAGVCEDCGGPGRIPLAPATGTLSFTPRGAPQVEGV